MKLRRRKAIASKKKPAGHPADALRDLLIATLDDNKAEEIVVVPLEGRSAIADYMIIATGRSARHVVGLSENISKELSKLGKHGRYEGRENGDWVLVDAGDIIVHLFRPEVRSFYNLEKIWAMTDETLPEVSPAARKTPAPRRRKVAAV